MKKLFLLATIITFSFTAHGQSSPDEIIHNFFRDYVKNTDKALDDLYATNPWTNRIKDAIEKLKTTVKGYTIEYVGKYNGYESIVKKQFSESFVLYSYMVKYDREPMRFTFEFYKPNDKWFLYSFNIDTDLDNEIEEAAKLYHTNLDKEK